jgi:hypothetical protein
LARMRSVDMALSTHTSGVAAPLAPTVRSVVTPPVHSLHRRLARAREIVHND